MLNKQLNVKMVFGKWQHCMTVLDYYEKDGGQISLIALQWLIC